MNIQISPFDLTLLELRPGIFLENEVNTMAVDALAPCVAMSLAAMILITHRKRAFVFHGEEFKQPVPS